MTGEDGSCASRAAWAAAFGAASGGALGAARATWSPSAPVILQGRSLPALMRTGRAASATAVTFALVGAVFASVDCAVEDLRGGKRDAWNGAAGGAAAGAALGVRLGSAGATAGAVAALAATAAGVDVLGRSLVADKEKAAAKTASYPPVSASE